MAETAKPKIVVGADHLGRELKDLLRDHLTAQGYEVCDMGTATSDPVDYPDVALPVAQAIAKGDFDRGILVCGTGAGVCVSANKVPGVIAVQVSDPYTAERARASNNAQIITFGALTIGPATAKALTDIFMAAEFQGGGSAKKVQKMLDIDQHYKKLAS
ncbi:RpiB/LacA/LacB family sugar-phosphate isomerase [Rhodospirillum rubrum]|uniref:Ribose-5-phosphate isomerase n=1 Tax=Rhodospirillum rubrum (strain ATCC 11170 / ATH 1.1.1 / DSM 467 / LMG 4362 / NCIMB 8255 / S1) TaxID=269796 RepID=Q2RUN5_RHORT|nr:RpiB/LacA/LacB family sugar-phosphate isomerase [Rhodospirillum rubrum]ABC22160.1 ribose-5-phosphate isomerase [Rhodospirillum rubrum ATCC 11170]AEO47874.1 ribose-5-phosphate isomerase [Rhodospirillum rubrum F11]MBK5953748.1 ribose-5-phosphate isomerase [Rhodospirillum rubrum]QXG81808.1 RpiB/LacA/LacB family sugar-phosphate isomerase [Rhodospirillum rubrum]HAP98960.1 RpiB/LacA/LacB family sugar-phosphate isomerase [Rhodospirillum rubrum]